MLTCAIPSNRVRPHHDHCTTLQVNLVKDESAEGQKWAAANPGISCLEKKKDGQLIFGLEVHGEWGAEVKPFRMQRA